VRPARPRAIRNGDRPVDVASEIGSERHTTATSYAQASPLATGAERASRASARPSAKMQQMVAAVGGMQARIIGCRGRW
jgi:hypothetical protein